MRAARHIPSLRRLMLPSPWPCLRPLRLLVGALTAITARSLLSIWLPLVDLAWSHSEVVAQCVEHPQINAFAIVVVEIVDGGIGDTSTAHHFSDVDAFVAHEPRKTIDKHMLSLYDSESYITDNITLKAETNA